MTVPWQTDGAQVSERVVHQLQPLDTDEPPQDPCEVLQLVRISQVLVGQVQLLEQHQRHEIGITT